MSVSLNAGSIVAKAGQQINVVSLINVNSGGNNPSYLVVSLLDRNEYTASSNGSTGTLSGNGHTASFSYLGGDSNTLGIVFTYDSATGQYSNATYGNLSNLIYTVSSNTNDNTSISFFTTNDESFANLFANDPYSLASYSPTYDSYVGSISVVTQPGFAGPTLSQATPESISHAAESFVGKTWNDCGCWVLASNISAEAGASLPITSTSLFTPGAASGEWIVAFNGPAGQSGDWQSQITAGEVVVFATSRSSGHITTVVSGSGSSAMLIDNIAYVKGNGQFINAANDGSPNDIIVARPHSATQEWAMAVPGTVVVYELDCPVITVQTPTSSVTVGNTEALAMLFSAANPLASQSITEYQFYDLGSGGAASDSFMVGGIDHVGHSAANAVTVSAAQLATASLLAGHSAGTDTVEVRAYNGSYWGDWASFTVNVTTTAPHNAPTVNVQNISVSENALIPGSSLITSISNPSRDTITEYAFWDGGTGNGHFTLNGTIQPDGQWIYVSVYSLRSIQYVAGPSPGSEALSIDIYDATTGTWSPSSTLTATTTASDVTVTQAFTEYSSNHSIAVSITDSSSNVIANLNGLNAMASAISAITLTDPSPPTIDLSGSQYLSDLQVIDRVASPSNLQITLNAGADSIPAPINNPSNSGGGQDTVIGDGQHDAITFSLPSTDYSVSANGSGGVTVTGSNLPTDQLLNVEFLKFTDKTIFVENGDNTSIARLYSAALGRAPDTGGLSGWEDVYANNVPASAKAPGVYVALAETPAIGGGLSIADGFIQSPEFQQKYGALDNTQFVTQLYENVLGRGPDQAGLSGWLAAMNQGSTQAVVLVGFAESPENIGKTAADWLFQH